MKHCNSDCRLTDDEDVMMMACPVLMLLTVLVLQSEETATSLRFEETSIAQ